MVLDLRLPDRAIDVLCLGAHPDDIEIGCGGTVLELAAARPDTRFHWIVLSGDARRRPEAEAGAALFLDGMRHDLELQSFRDGYFPYEGAPIKDYFESLKGRMSPDLVFTHHRHDRHQDHRVVSELTWNTFRDHLVLEYEVPKYDGDVGQPNLYVPLSDGACVNKLQHLRTAFGSQSSKDWFDDATFAGLMRIRGLECRSPSGHAEAFHAYKARLEL